MWPHFTAMEERYRGFSKPNLCTVKLGIETSRAQALNKNVLTNYCLFIHNISCPHVKNVILKFSSVLPKQKSTWTTCIQSSQVYINSYLFSFILQLMWRKTFQNFQKSSKCPHRHTNKKEILINHYVFLHIYEEKRHRGSLKKLLSCSVNNKKIKWSSSYLEHQRKLTSICH